MKIEYQKTTQEDENVIKRQLNAAHVRSMGIVEKCRHGYPRIILLSPMASLNNEEINYEAISNVFWLTCPYLNDRIHRIESDGLSVRISDFVHNDLMFRGIMNRAHAHFYYLRKNLFQDYFKTSLPESKMRVFNTGIGGSRDVNSLKCLHIQYCHYRVFTENITGRIISELLNNVIDCKGVICKHAG